MVGPRIRANQKFLKQLAKCTSHRKRTQYVHNATDDELLCLVEIAYNILKGRLPLTAHHKRKLVQVADLVRQLRRTKTPKGARNVVQKGGGYFLASLLAPVLLEIGRYLVNGS